MGVAQLALGHEGVEATAHTRRMWADGALYASRDLESTQRQKCPLHEVVFQQCDCARRPPLLNV